MVTGMETSEKSLKALRVLDSIGVCLSFGCAIHCMLVPILFTVLPFLGLGFFIDETFEAVMMGITLVIASCSLCWGTRLHKRYRLFGFVVAAMALFIAAHEVAHGYHYTLVALGGLSIATAHLLNRKLCRSCTECADHGVRLSGAQV